MRKRMKPKKSTAPDDYEKLFKKISHNAKFIKAAIPKNSEQFSLKDTNSITKGYMDLFDSQIKYSKHQPSI